jgi:MFS family permease
LTIFFRPARSAVIPRIVAPDELVTANSATWLGETLADVIGYPLAGLFVAFLARSLPLAFWMDSATYLVSASLILVTRIPPVRRDEVNAAETGGFWSDLVAGLRFLRREPVLWANTLQAVVAQFTIGATIALTPIYASRVLAAPGPTAATEGPAIYAFMETLIGFGSLLGGFVVGLVGSRIARGRMVIAGYVGYGLAVVAMGLTGNTVAALGLCFGMGIANMVFVIPTQTLFQERTPEGMMGRVLSFRFSVVFGSMTLAMAISGLLGDAFGVQVVFVLFGAVTTIAGVAGFASRALRRA